MLCVYFIYHPKKSLLIESGNNPAHTGTSSRRWHFGCLSALWLQRSLLLVSISDITIQTATPHPSKPISPQLPAITTMLCSRYNSFFTSLPPQQFYSNHAFDDVGPSYCTKFEQESGGKGNIKKKLIHFFLYFPHQLTPLSFIALSHHTFISSNSYLS